MSFWRESFYTFNTHHLNFLSMLRLPFDVLWLFAFHSLIFSMFDVPNSTQIQRLFYMHDYPEIAYIFSLATILRCLSTEKIYM